MARFEEIVEGDTGQQAADKIKNGFANVGRFQDFEVTDDFQVYFEVTLFDLTEWSRIGVNGKERYAGEYSRIINTMELTTAAEKFDKVRVYE